MTVTVDELTRQNKKKLADLEKRLGYAFTDPTYLQRALIHSSFAFEQGETGEDNETFEFLGDAVLDLTVGYMLLKRFPAMREGELTRLRSALVNERSLAAMARRIELGNYLFLGKGEDASNGREKASILACAYEAMIGAIFLDSSYERSLDFVNEHFSPLLDNKKERLLFGDAKSQLQETIQAQYNEAPEYLTEKEEGPAHDRKFTVSVRFHSRVLGIGKAKSKKEAEQKAAAVALQDIDNLMNSDELSKSGDRE